MKIVSTFLLCLMFASFAWSASCPTVLFRVAKSTNNWAVVYEAKLADGKLADEPMEMYWQKQGSSSKRELGWLETKMAYGIKYLSKTKGEKYVFTVAALEDQRITLLLNNGCPVATTEINGKETVLAKVFVELTGTTNIKWIDLTGTNGSTERLINE